MVAELFFFFFKILKHTKGKHTLHGLKTVLNPLEFKSKMYSKTDLQFRIQGWEMKREEENQKEGKSLETYPNLCF